MIQGHEIWLERSKIEKDDAELFFVYVTICARWRLISASFVFVFRPDGSRGEPFYCGR